MKTLGVRPEATALFTPGAKKALGVSQSLAISSGVMSGKAIFAWGLLNMVAIQSMWFLGLAQQINPGNFMKYISFSIAGFLAVAYTRYRVPPSVPAGLKLIGFLQIWFTFCTIYATIVLMRTSDFGSADYSLVTFILAFLQGAALTYLFPDLRKKILIYLYVLGGASFIMGLLQMAHFGPAISYGNAVIGFEQIDDWGGKGGVRAPGLFPSIGVTVVFNLLIASLIGATALVRKLKGYEMALLAAAFLSLVFVQVRSAAPQILAVYAFVTYALAKRYGSRALLLSLLCLGGIVLIVASFPEKFAYTLSTLSDQTTLDYRTDVLWPQAIHIYEQHPFTGIGVEPAFAGYETLETRYVRENILDSGWMVALAYGGLPGVCLLGLTCLAGLVGSCMAVRFKSNYEDDTHRIFGIAGIFVVLSLALSLAVGNTFTNVSIGMPYFMLLGCMTPRVFKKLQKVRALRTA